MNFLSRSERTTLGWNPYAERTGYISRLLNSAVVTFFNLAKCRAKLVTQRVDFFNRATLAVYLIGAGFEAGLDFFRREGGVVNPEFRD